MMNQQERSRSSGKTVLVDSNVIEGSNTPVISLPNTEYDREQPVKKTTLEIRVAPGNHAEHTEITPPSDHHDNRERHARFVDDVRDSAPALPLRKKVKTNNRKKSLNKNCSRQSDGAIIIPETEDDVGYLNPSNNSLLMDPVPRFIDKQQIADGLRRRGQSAPQGLQTVLIKLAFLKLGEIRTIHEDFAADIFLQSRWRETLLDRRTWRKDYELPNSEDYWNPEITIENCVGDAREKIWYVVTYDEKGKAYICEKRRVKGVFSETMELGMYPFDTQRFTITLMSSMFESEVSLQKDPTNVDDVTLQTFSDQQEWTLHKQMEVFHHELLTKEANNQPPKPLPSHTSQRRPTLSLSLKATRRASYFLWNIVLFMIFICSLIFATFAVEYNLVQNRLQLAFILILSNITFKRVVSANLPKISYMTYLDYYVVIQTAIMFLVSVWHAIVFQISNPGRARMADRIALIVLGGIYIIENVIFFFIWGAAVYKLKRFSIHNMFVN